MTKDDIVKTYILLPVARIVPGDIVIKQQWDRNVRYVDLTSIVHLVLIVEMVWAEYKELTTLSDRGISTWQAHSKENIRFLIKT